jgi:exopolyphosphatase / guanosine-5'-triphosphate,3'-diphosphate pyrophosphatase
VAAIDCGTNSTRLLIVGPGGEPIVRQMRITRLGQGVDATRRLDPAAIARTVDVLAAYRKEMDAHEVRAARMAATSAVRDAENGRAFLDAAERTVGVPAELLTGAEEGRLAYAGATADLPGVPGDVVVVDIGGGSTELIVDSGAGLGVVSLDLGCVRLTERSFAHDPPLPGELGDARALIAAQLDRAEAEVPALRSLAPGSRLIGLAGTVSTLAMLEHGVADYDRNKVHHVELRLETVDRWVETLASEPAARRAERPGMVPGRDDVIVGGALVLQAVMGRFGFDRCLVSESDILDGLAASIPR